MRVLQRDYDEFYKQVLFIVEYGDGDTCCAISAPYFDGEKRSPSIVDHLQKKLNIAESEIKRE